MIDQIALQAAKEAYCLSYYKRPHDDAYECIMGSSLVAAIEAYENNKEKNTRKLNVPIWKVREWLRFIFNSEHREELQYNVREVRSWIDKWEKENE